ncbi:unnamed protein product, partial [marine sediment metagenome]
WTRHFPTSLVAEATLSSKRKEFITVSGSPRE